MNLRVVLLLACAIGFTEGHGRLWEPPSRSSMWRRGYNTTVNINDNELSCGGFTNQWVHYNGLCGVCGDPYQQFPRDNEIGGKYSSGIITRTYPIGGVIKVMIGLTANHNGYFQFKMCPITDNMTQESNECMKQYPLRILNGDGNSSKFYVRPDFENEIILSLLLPQNFICEHCVLQWHYRTGSRWGCDPDKSCGMGKGPQEEFFSCSDIAIANVPETIFREPELIGVSEISTNGLNDLGTGRGAEHIGDGQYLKANDFDHQHGVLRNSANKKNPKLKVPEETSPFSKKIESISKQQLLDYVEKLTLNAMLIYFGVIPLQNAISCTAAKRFFKNPIIHEFCRQTCSNTFEGCSEYLCDCERKTSFRYSMEGKRFLDDHRRSNKTHLQIKQNKLVEDLSVIPHDKQPSSMNNVDKRMLSDKYNRINFQNVYGSKNSKNGSTIGDGTINPIDEAQDSPTKITDVNVYMTSVIKPLLNAATTDNNLNKINKQEKASTSKSGVRINVKPDMRIFINGNPEDAYIISNSSNDGKTKAKKAKTYSRKTLNLNNDIQIKDQHLLEARADKNVPDARATKVTDLNHTSKRIQPRTTGACVASTIYSNIPDMVTWCNIHCLLGYCPSTFCVCDM